MDFLVLCFVWFCLVFSFEFQWATQTQAENEQILFQGLELIASISVILESD